MADNERKDASSSSARHLFVYAGTDGKAGMEGVDEAKQLEVISNFSKNSAYNQHAEEMDKQHDEPIRRLQAKAKSMSVMEADKYYRRARTEVHRLESMRNFERHMVVIDFDAFYASVEQRDFPELRGKAMAVGGGVITTASYEARKFGVRSGMHFGLAKQLCPQLIVVDSHFDKYREASQQMSRVVMEYDPHPSMCSLDEIIFDMTDSATARMTGSGREVDIKSPAAMRALVETMVEEIRAKIYSITRLTVSAGIANNSTLAKICSNIRKPNGQYSLAPNRDAVLSFLGTLPVRKYPGIGRVMEKYLTSLGFHTFGDVRGELGKVLFLFGGLERTSFLLGACLGIRKQEGIKKVEENLPENAVTRKSIGVERTFLTIKTTNEFIDKLDELSTSLGEDMVKHGLQARALTLKLKTSKYVVTTRDTTTSDYFQSKERIFEHAHKLLSKQLKEQPSLKEVGLRLIGISARKFKNAISTEEREQVKHGQYSIDAFLQSPQRQAASSSSKAGGGSSSGSSSEEGLSFDNPVQLLSSQSDPEEDDDEEDVEDHEERAAPECRGKRFPSSSSFSSAPTRAQFVFPFGEGGEEEEEEDEEGDHISDLHAMASSALVMENSSKRARLS